jgi:hypothetical protein
MKTVSNTSRRQVITCVQFKEHLFNITYKLTLANRYLLSAHLNFLYTVEMQSRSVYFKKQNGYQSKLHVSWHYSQAVFCFLSHLLGFAF